jgi:hypothetical protein
MEPFYPGATTCVVFIGTAFDSLATDVWARRPVKPPWPPLSTLRSRNA